MRLQSLIAFTLALSLSTGCSQLDQYHPFDCFKTTSPVPGAPPIDLPPPHLSIHSGEVTAIIQDYSVELKNFKHLYLQDAKTYYNDEGIHTIQLRYISQDLLELCEARKLIIDVSEGLLDQLNSNCLLVPEFTNHAFYPFNLEIYISFESFFAKYVDPFYIKWIVMEDAKLAFYTADVDDNDKLCWHSRKETYNTSRDIVFYQRLAEDKFEATHAPDRSVFGDKRYYPD